MEDQPGPSLRGVVTVRPFGPQDQASARRLILEGLVEHFGRNDETLNRDLDDIAASFSDGVFVVAVIDGAIAGTGGFHLQGDGTAHVVRMSTAAPHRRHGIGSAVLARLIEEARAAGCRRVTLATNADWHDAIAFYQAKGFSEALITDSGVAFTLSLPVAG